MALSDWEESSLGDPASDFAHTQELLPPPTGWSNGSKTFHLKDALAFYENVSGIPITEERLNFYRESVLENAETIARICTLFPPRQFAAHRKRKAPSPFCMGCN